MSSDIETHSYVIRIYIMGEIVEETEFNNVSDARDKYFLTSDLTSCYTQLIYDGKKLNITETERVLDSDGMYLKRLRHFRLLSAKSRKLNEVLDKYNYL